MQKLYYENQYEKNFTAEITDIVEKNNEFNIVLDKTYFFPEHSEFPCDLGYIENIPVTKVYENNGIIYHVTSRKPIKIHRVKCSIDFEHRFDNMQQHLGQHIISSCFIKLFNANTIKVNFDANNCNIHVDKTINSSQIEELESLANNIIFKNISVESLYPSKSELKKLSIKKTVSNSYEKIRLISISDIDIVPCYELHPNSTLEVQLIKITNLEQFKTHTKISFLCGKRAVDYLFTRDNFSSKICNVLKCNENVALSKIEELTENYNKIYSENKNLQSKIADFEIQNMISKGYKINDITIIKSIHTTPDLKYVKLLASKLTAFENIIVLFAVQWEDTAHLIFMCSKNLKNINMGSLLKDAISLIDGSGGGSPTSAQGGGKNNSNLSSSLDYAFMKIKKCI